MGIYGSKGSPRSLRYLEMKLVSTIESYHSHAVSVSMHF